MNICRTCMANTKAELVPIFSKLEGEFIANVIVDCSSVMIIEDDGLPAFVCTECLLNIKQILVFAKKARESDQKLRQLFKSEVSLTDFEKQEPNEAGERRESDWFDVLVTPIKTEETAASEHAYGSSQEVGNESEFEDFDDGNDSDWVNNDEMDSDDDLPLAKSIIKAKRKSVKSAKSEQDNEVKQVRPTKKKRPVKIDSDEDDDDDDDENFPEDDILDEKEQEMFELVVIDPARHICCLCSYDFDTRDELEAHGKAAHEKKKRISKINKPFFCQVCYKRYCSEDALQDHHIVAAGLASKKFYQCKLCPVRFHSAKRRRNHAHNHPKSTLVEEHSDTKNKRPPICCGPNCYRECESVDELYKHGMKVHGSKKRSVVDPALPHECPICFKCFETKKSLARHRNRILTSDLHQCTMCGKQLKSRNSLVIHERKHRDERPYSCEMCAKRFPTMQALKWHQLVHKEDKPFGCNICGWSFKRECNLKIHMLTHSDTLPFKCTVCQKSFKGKYHLQYHMRIHTGHKPWPCRYCDKSFADHANRARHEISHTGIKPYKCSYCDKSFIRRRYQIEHESTHTGIKPYRCEMCNRTFGQKTALKRHLDMHPLASENQKSLEQPSPMSEIQPMSPELPR
ncbi:zinc finger protein ZFP2-like isoform X2 [Topomyia yanbarensis]|uniref:zinc finger protein ZFP2-like isoform X2 n=1 Tax=Topomyia yanbarensis TaxID=2498891 RepID=UPI00273A876B|nr:zinc finger protein ZFP2-like isoform X2 [Topomyia yanbarensis]